MSAKPAWRYRIVVRLASPVLFVHALLRTYRDGGWRYLQQRLGYYKPDTTARLWIHAASVGEVITVLPLVEQLQAANPTPLLITTNTPTGAAVLQARQPVNTQHAYLPLDYPGATLRFFTAHKLSTGWIVETEIWPWLFSRARTHGVAVSIINARMGKRSNTGIAKLFSQTYRQALIQVQVLARTERDAQLFVNAGASADNTRTIGNLKFATTSKPAPPQRLINQSYCVAASTHHDEEIRLAQRWLLGSREELLVIVPRHAERGETLGRQLAALQKQISPTAPSVARRSIGQLPTAGCRLYIADTLGELNNWYAFATASFIGGSLIDRGGHNMLEAVRCQQAIIVGPHTQNFPDVMDLLTEVNGIAVAAGENQVVEFLHLAMDKPEWASSLAERASSAIAGTELITDLYLSALTEKGL